MPGFDGTGPMGEGSMTGGGRGLCGPYNRPYGFGQSGFGWGRGYGRGYRHVYRATGIPGWRRAGRFGPWGVPVPGAYYGESEETYLRNRASALRQELEALDRRIQKMETEAKGD